MKNRLIGALLALLRVVVCEFVVIAMLVSLYMLFVFESHTAWNIEKLFYVPLGVLVIVGIIMASKFIFGYYAALFFLYAIGLSWFKTLSRFRVGLINIVVASCCLLIGLGLDWAFNGSLIDDLFTDSWRIGMMVGIAWVSSFLSIIIPSITRKILPDKLSVKWFFL